MLLGSDMKREDGGRWMRGFPTRRAQCTVVEDVASTLTYRRWEACSGEVGGRVK